MLALCAMEESVANAQTSIAGAVGVTWLAAIDGWVKLGDLPLGHTRAAETHKNKTISGELLCYRGTYLINI